MARLPTTRRDFLGIAGGAALVCTIGGEEIAVDGPAALDRADAAAARVTRPPGAAAVQQVPQLQPAPGGDRADAAQQFPQLQPAPGGVRREYWLQAQTVVWDIVPTNRDDWHNRRIRGRTKFRAFVYREMTAGFAGPKGGINIPGPTLEAEVGDVLVVHFRNADTRLRQAVTIHPHGVRYSPEYDGAYMGEHTRVGGFVAPGESFTYQWECTPDSVGAWPYHDHGPNHTLNTFRGLFGAIVIRPKGARRPDVLYTLFAHQLPPPVTRIQRNFQCVNGRAYAGNTPTLRARVGQDVELHAFSMDNAFHTFHLHGHRWRDAAGAFVDNPSMGPNETVTARFVEDNPGRWLYHCHVFSHQDAGMTGWYDVAP